MRAKLISYKPETDKQGRPLYHLFLDTMSKKGTFDCYTGPAFFNFRRWRTVINLLDERVEVWLDNLVVKDPKKRLINADSAFFYYRRVWPQDVKSA